MRHLENHKDLFMDFERQGNIWINVKGTKRLWIFREKI